MHTYARATGEGCGEITGRPRRVRFRPWGGMAFGALLNALLLLLLLAACSAASSTYSESEALVHSYLAGASYCSAASLERWQCGASCNALPSGVSNLTWFMGDNDDAFGFVGRYEGKCVASFRGTTELKGWMRDLESVLPRRLDNCSFQGDTCEVGDGFLKNYLSFRPAFLSAVDGLGCGHTSSDGITVVGHSLGASEAAIAMWDLHVNGYALSAGYTFGQPRTGNKAFHDAFTAAGLVQWRVTHHKDPVVHLPPEALGFHHVATEVFYPGLTSENYTVCDGSGEADKCADQFWDVPAMMVVCLEDGEKECDHLTYLFNARTFRLDSESCE